MWNFLKNKIEEQTIEYPIEKNDNKFSTNK